MNNPKPVSRFQQMLAEMFGFGPVVSLSVLAVFGLMMLFAVFWFFHSAPPKTIIITSGDDGTRFRKTADKYAKILERSGVTLKILKSEGSLENLKRLEDPNFQVDVGFVQGGVAKGQKIENLVSLGSVFYEPLFIFYRGSKQLDVLSDFSGKRLAIGEDGTGTQVLALELLDRNGIKPDGPTQLLKLDDDAAAAALLAGRIDAAFMMSDSASSKLVHDLLRQPGIRLFDFSQADAYTRRYGYLNKTLLPKGSIDFGKRIPDQDLSLVSPTVELIARADLNPALSDLLLEAATEVHTKAGLTNKRGEFPSPRENEYPISPDAARYYKSGKTFLYRYMPFWLASLVNRVIVVFVPMLLIMIPSVRSVPKIYRWHMRLRIIRWYRALLMLEKSMVTGPLGPVQVEEIKRQLEHIERAVNRMKVPASFADQFYGLRVNIDFVRAKLTQAAPAMQGSPVIAT